MEAICKLSEIPSGTLTQSLAQGRQLEWQAPPMPRFPFRTRLTIVHESQAQIQTQT